MSAANRPAGPAHHGGSRQGSGALDRAAALAVRTGRAVVLAGACVVVVPPGVDAARVLDAASRAYVPRRHVGPTYSPSAGVMTVRPRGCVVLSLGVLDRATRRAAVRSGALVVSEADL